MLVAFDFPCMNAKDITLRPGRPADAARIAAMSRDLIESGLGWSWGPERVARSIANKGTFTLLACDRDRVGARRRRRHDPPRAARGQHHRAQFLQVARFHRVGLYPGVLPRARNGAAHDAGAAQAGRAAARLARAEAAQELTGC